MCPKEKSKSGFDEFYGFVGGETNPYYPVLYEGTWPVGPDKTLDEGCHFTEDLTDKIIHWVRRRKSLMHNKPFFSMRVADNWRRLQK
jgi:arylsulfatase A-like enzyme